MSIKRDGPRPWHARAKPTRQLSIVRCRPEQLIPSLVNGQHEYRLQFSDWTMVTT